MQLQGSQILLAKKVAHEVGKKLLCDVTTGINQVIESGCVQGGYFPLFLFLQALDYLENYVISRCHHYKLFSDDWMVEYKMLTYKTFFTLYHNWSEIFACC